MSHNPFSRTQNNGKTLESFFADWGQARLAQLFLQPEGPDFGFCTRYFRITDYEALDSVLFGRPMGYVIDDPSTQDAWLCNASGPIRRLYESRRRQAVDRTGLNKLIHASLVDRRPAAVLSRDLVWGNSRWNTKALQAWILRFAPGVLFFQGSSSVFGYRIAEWIYREFKLPLILQLTDDYTRPLYPLSPIERLNKRRYRAALKSSIRAAHTVIAISDYMAEEYRSLFGGHYLTLMNSIDCPHAITEQRTRNESIGLLFAGNVHIGRWEVLRTIGDALARINKTYNTQCVLSIHSPTPIPQALLARLDDGKAIRCGATLTQEELSRKIEESTILVHVESFDRRMRAITRLSISSKIPEYLASKRSIFATGPADVASIRYLSENRLAQVANSPSVEAVESQLMPLILSPELRRNLIQRAYAAYELRHDPRKTRDTISQVMRSAWNAQS